MSPGHTSPTHETEYPQPGGYFFVPQDTKEQHKPKNIVITGGPASGKTTAIEHLKRTWPDLEYIDEAATMVLASGFPTPTDEQPWTQGWQNALQAAVAGMQLGLEKVTREYNDEKTIIQDRGLLDGASYLKRGVDELEELVGIDRQEMLSRYHAVIYLGWLTSRKYGNTSNPQRFEDEYRAQQLSEKVRQCWEGHPNLIEVTAQHNRTKAVEKLLPNLLN